MSPINYPGSARYNHYKVSNNELCSTQVITRNGLSASSPMNRMIEEERSSYRDLKRAQVIAPDEHTEINSLINGFYKLKI